MEWVYFEDIEVGQVREYGGRTVTREEIIRFAHEFDPQNAHLDDGAAGTTVFGGLIASGWHTTALLMRMMVDEFLGTSAAIASPGAERIRWLKAVKPGDRLWVRSEVLETAPSKSKPDRGRVKMDHRVFNQRGEMVMTVVGLGYFRRRKAA